MSWTGSKLTEILAETKGAVAFLFLEDRFWAQRTIDHLEQIGFGQILAFGRAPVIADVSGECLATFEVADMRNATAVEILNKSMPRLANRWVYYGFNGEFLHFPFDTTRKIDDFCGFISEERRVSVMTSKIDLYPKNGCALDAATELKECRFDKMGYFSRNREDMLGLPLDNQIDLGGGFRWRMMDHLPQDSFWINRSQIFKPVAGLRLGADFRFNLDAYETAQSKWHNSPSATVTSIRAYRYLSEQLGEDRSLHDLEYPGSAPYAGTGQQFMDLGLMEPGQWF